MTRITSAQLRQFRAGLLVGLALGVALMTVVLYFHLLRW